MVISNNMSLQTKTSMLNLKVLMLFKRYLMYKGLPWLIVFTMTIEQASSAIAPLQTKIIICGAVFWLVFSIIGWYLADQIARPLMRTSQIAKLLLNATDNTPGYYYLFPFFQPLTRTFQ
jgi:hypothetical protein